MVESSISDHFLYRRKESDGHVQKTPWKHVEKTAISRSRRQGSEASLGLTLTWWSRLLNYEKTQFCGFSCSVCGALLRKSKKIHRSVNPIAVRAYDLV